MVLPTIAGSAAKRACHAESLSITTRAVLRRSASLNARPAAGFQPRTPKNSEVTATPVRRVGVRPSPLNSTSRPVYSARPSTERAAWRYSSSGRSPSGTAASSPCCRRRVRAEPVMGRGADAAGRHRRARRAGRPPRRWRPGPPCEDRERRMVAQTAHGMAKVTCEAIECPDADALVGSGHSVRTPSRRAAVRRGAPHRATDRARERPPPPHRNGTGSRRGGPARSDPAAASHAVARATRAWLLQHPGHDARHPEPLAAFLLEGRRPRAVSS